MDHYIEVTCKCQQNEKMSLSWCDRNQYQQLCAGCAHNEGRKRSKYQQQKDRERSTGQVKA